MVIKCVFLFADTRIQKLYYILNSPMLKYVWSDTLKVRASKFAETR